jgi:hypothetical protein
MHSDQPMFYLTARTALEARAFNHLMSQIDADHHLRLFHQVGGTTASGDEAGVHGWETWAGVSRATCEAMLPELNRRWRLLLAELG